MSTLMKRGWAVGLALALFPVVAASQQFPSKPITIVVTFPPAGIGDTQSRLIGAELQKRWGQPVVVENRPGAGGHIGLQHFQRQAPDGHTLMSGASVEAMRELFLKTASFRPGKDVAPVASTVYAPYVIITSAQLPVKNLKEFLALIRANPGKYNFAFVPNIGPHLSTLNFIERAGIDMTMVPYQGGAASLRSVLANEAQAYFGAALGLEQNVKAGKIVALAVTSARRFPVLPDLPTVKESVGIDFDAGVLYGMFTVVGTPTPVVDRLNREIVDIMHNADAGEKLRQQSYEIRTSTPAEFAAVMMKELNEGREIAKANGIEPK